MERKVRVALETESTTKTKTGKCERGKRKTF
jgi:hypothetical protein